MRLQQGRFVFLWLATACCLLPTAAQAQRVLVLGFRNDLNNDIRADIERALDGDETVERIDQANYEQMLKRLDLHEPLSVQEIRKLCQAYAVDAMVLGSVGETAVIRALGSGGQTLWEGELPLRFGRISDAQARRVANAVLTAVAFYAQPAQTSRPPPELPMGARRRASAPASVPATPSPPPVPPPASDEDVVEIVEDDESSSPPSAPDPLTVSDGEAGAILEARGWARERAYLGLWNSPKLRAPVDPFAVPYQKVSNDAQLFLRLRYAKSNRYEAVVSGLLSQGAFLRTNLPVAHTEQIQTRFEPSLREAYVGVFWPSVDLRIGQQRLAWGRGDAFTPNDVLNVVDVRDPLLSEREAFNVPTFMVRGDWDLGALGLQWVVAPFFTPSLLDAYGTNWALIQEGTPAKYRGLANLLSSFIDPSLQDQAQAFFKQTALPKNDLSATSAGLHATYTLNDVDLGMYYHYGYTQTPQLLVAPWFDAALDTVDFTQPAAQNLAPLLVAVQQQGAPVSMKYERRHHVGLDAATTVGTFGLRADASWDSKQVFFSPEFRSYLLPAFQAVLAVEYQTGDLGKTLLVETWYQRVFNAPVGVPLLGAREHSAAWAVLWRWTYWEHIELELRAILRLAPQGYMVRPQISWRTGSFAAGVGFIALGGEPVSIGNYFQRNRSVYLHLKYMF